MGTHRWELEVKKTDVLVIGGGAAGIYAAVTAREANPELSVTVLEKAHISRSGCLAAGINAINAYLNPGETAKSFLDYVKKENHGLVRDDLVLTMAQGLNSATDRLYDWGLPLLKDEAGRYLARGKRSVRANGERIKPIMAQALRASGAQVLNRVNGVNLFVKDGRVRGVFACSTREEKMYLVLAKAVICTTGGAAGIYKPNNPGAARHKMWYCPFNTGAGYAMGLRAGAEMTSFEMRFIALRTKDTISPTGTIAQGVRVPQVNALGEEYLHRYGARTTPERLAATLAENMAGRGPCYLDTARLDKEASSMLKEAYLNMSPSILLKWADEEAEPHDKPVEICGSEPYIVGGHGMAGFWVDAGRRTTLPGLYAAGDVAGGAPKKYVTGSMAEGELAALAAVADLGEDLALLSEREAREALAAEAEAVLLPLGQDGGFTPKALQKRLQKVMDEYAGGISAGYRVAEPSLMQARQKLRQLAEDVALLQAKSPRDLTAAHETADRVLIARVVVEHLLHRRESRWPCYQERLDYPDRDDEKWLKFVNSRYDKAGDTVVLMERPYEGGVFDDSSD
ncbi:adenylyl-sulfate reductase subunit alpha [Dethiobacter alkaliphilus]|uniref:adenylyl-sulfate reductase subunit alpha n=1 Tax=Dethiobacter alkaliphilus TaxID=427926 RepID=UPI0022262536|nr:adenylyl-sulfate reductase subunit alpha [Dethiobacter alkaliphilus]MCW3491263.1 adenylyl-sulfate reductase subunit alpha [Dethiobacter alkaliphilus]